MPLSEALYATAASAAIPGLKLMLRARVRRGREIAARLPERYGLDAAARPPGRLVWLHAASVGETISVMPLLPHLDGTVLFTTGTVTSAGLLARALRLAGLEARVIHRFAPLDVPRWVARFLDTWRPDAAAFVESEVWPNMLAACRARAIPVALVNARLSARSAARWARAPGLARALFGRFALVAAQSHEDAARLADLGARDVTVPGNLKFAAPELAADPAELARLTALLGDRPRFLAASTHEGDEQMAAALHAALAPRFPGLLAIVAPRHPDRGTALADTLGAPRRALGQDPPVQAGIWIADTMGELGLLYRLAPIVIMGKSFSGGGQNPLEPARLGCAVAAGPHMENFAEAAARLEEAGGLARLADPAALSAWLGRMLADPAMRTEIGEAGRRVASAEADLPRRLAASLNALG